jgi:hypothetical protein
MAGDAFEGALAGFQRWAGTTERKLSGDLENDAAELDRASEVTGAGQRRAAVISLLRRAFHRETERERHAEAAGKRSRAAPLPHAPRPSRPGMTGCC